MDTSISKLTRYTRTSEYVLSGFRFPKHEVDPWDWYLIVTELLNRIKPKLQYLSGFSPVRSNISWGDIREEKIQPSGAIKATDHCVQLWDGNSKRKGALFARLFLLKDGRLFLCDSTQKNPIDRGAGYTHQIECLDDAGLQQFFRDNNLVYQAGYQVLRALFDLVKSTLEKMDERRAGIHEMRELLRSTLGRITCNPADPTDFPFS